MDGPTTVYKLFDAEGVLLYVGITGRGLERMYQHNGSKPWWSEVAEIQLEHLATRQEALRREMGLIVSLGPKHNIQHRRRGASPYVLPARLEEETVKALVASTWEAASTKAVENLDERRRAAARAAEIAATSSGMNRAHWLTVVDRLPASLVDSRANLLRRLRDKAADRYDRGLVVPPDIHARALRLLSTLADLHPEIAGRVESAA